MTPRDWCVLLGLLAGAAVAVWMWWQGRREDRMVDAAYRELDRLLGEKTRKAQQRHKTPTHRH